jgi:hypothetical protein
MKTSSFTIGRKAEVEVQIWGGYTVKVLDLDQIELSYGLSCI